MKLFAAVVATLVLSAQGFSQFYGYKEAPTPGQGRVATDARNANVRVDQKLGDAIDLNLPFKNDKGEDIKLGDLFHKRPVVLLPIFYQCPGVCTNELDQLMRSVQGFRKDDVGETFDIVVVSIDHAETPALAAKKKELYVDFYENATKPEFRRKGTRDGWHFLTGSEESVRSLTDQIGFRFTRDPVNKNIVHPAALVVLSPAGKISRYFLTTEYPQRILLDSILLAQKEAVGVKDDRPFYLACIHVDPLTGQKSLNVMNTLKTFGLLTVIILAISIVTMSIRNRTQPGEPNNV